MSALRLRRRPIGEVVQQFDAFTKVTENVQEEKKTTGGLSEFTSFTPSQVKTNAFVMIANCYPFYFAAFYNQSFFAVSVISFLLIGWLVVGELRYFLDTDFDYKFLVDVEFNE